MDNFFSLKFQRRMNVHLNRQRLHREQFSKFEIEHWSDFVVVSLIRPELFDRLVKFKFYNINYITSLGRFSDWILRVLWFSFCSLNFLSKKRSFVIVQKIFPQKIHEKRQFRFFLIFLTFYLCIYRVVSSSINEKTSRERTFVRISSCSKVFFFISR